MKLAFLALLISSKDTKILNVKNNEKQKKNKPKTRNYQDESYVLKSRTGTSCAHAGLRLCQVRGYTIVSARLLDLVLSRVFNPALGVTQATLGIFHEFQTTCLHIIHAIETELRVGESD